MTTLSIVKSAQHRTWVLQDDHQAIGSLHVTHAASASGELRTIDGTFPIARHRRNRGEIAVGDRFHPILTLARYTATISGYDEPVSWEIRGRFSRFHAVLGAYQRTIVLDTARWREASTGVQVSGYWEHRDLVVLACFFALIARRRRSIILLSG